ncbi:MAG: hypothetical protein WA705_29055 [Candidatus Ozemobacteraceae bacterium]
MSNRAGRGLKKSVRCGPVTSSYGWGYSRKSQSDWKGVGIGDAFKKNLDYYQRIPAQRLFYKVVSQAQTIAAGEAGVDVEGKSDLPIKPQLSPCYTGSFPTNLSVWAAVGETAFLTYSHFAEKSLLQDRMKDWLKNPAVLDGFEWIDPRVYQTIALTTVKAVEARLVMDDLARTHGLEAVETFRLFLSSQYEHFSSLQEMIRAVVLFGEILPDWRNQKILHPLTRKILVVLEDRSRLFYDSLAKCIPSVELSGKTPSPVDMSVAGGNSPNSGRLKLGETWVYQICRALVPFLPPPPLPVKPQAKEDPANSTQPNPAKKEFPSLLSRLQSQAFEGMGPRPPTIEVTDDPEKIFASAVNARLSGSLRDDTLSQAESPESPEKELLKKICQTIQKAGGQSEKYEDMRTDLVEQSIRAKPFEKGVIEGSPTDGCEISVSVGGEAMTGQIFDRPLPLSEDLPKLEALLREARPIIRALKRNLYPNLDQVFDPIRFQVGGRIDPSRLHSFQTSPAIYQRFQVFDEPDPRGSPLLLLTCDASGSLSTDQMAALKILSASWLEATVQSDIKILAGTYTSDTIRQGVSGPVVSWIYHPRKTPSLGKRDAIRAVVTLPDNGGTGAQSDVLSLGFMLNEARALARGGMIYLVMLSDCAWNKSFVSTISCVEEVQGFFQDQIVDFGNKLNITLCALGSKDEEATGLVGLAHKIILLHPEELRKPTEVSKKISEYVASCFRERTAFNRR